MEENRAPVTLGSSDPEGLGDGRGSFGELMPCPKCGGKPYAYDLRGSGTHELCTVECGACDHEVQGATPEAAAAEWHAPSD